MSATTPADVRDDVLGVVEGWLVGYTDGGGHRPQERVRIVEGGDASVVLRYQRGRYFNDEERHFRVTVSVEEVPAP